MTEESYPRPGHWVRVDTDAGFHLALIGANGETVLTSEVYTDPAQVLHAIEQINRTGPARLHRIIDRKKPVPDES